MEREFVAHHIKEDDSGLEHLIASMQPKKYSKDYSKHSKEHWKISEALEVLEELGILDACSTRVRRARELVGPRPTGLCTSHSSE